MDPSASASLCSGQALQLRSASELVTFCMSNAKHQPMQSRERV